ncbi:TPA: amino acid permease [Klebsiella pneumoniae]|nr:amino acid permease [Klebsiella pneumoniae]HBX7980871.1 amino acid permease [Klebsiella pneumoniae]
MAAMSLGIYYWGARSCLPQANFSGDEEEYRRTVWSR